MPTVFFLRSDTSDLGKQARVTRGAGVATIVDDSSATHLSSFGLGTTTAGGGAQIYFATESLNAFTLSANPVITYRAQESNAMANHGIGNTNLFRCESDGSGAENIGTGALPSVELTTSEASSTETITLTAPPYSITAGQRFYFLIRWRAGVGGTAASGYTLTFSYNGTSGGGSGDAFVTFSETITEQGGAAPTSAPPRRDYRQYLSHSMPFRRRRGLFVPGWEPST